MPVSPHSRVGIAQRARRLGVSLLAALAVAAIASPAMPTPAAATPITYTLSNVSATFGTRGTVTFTGTFVFDPSSSALDAVSITATASPTPTTLLTTSPETFTSPVAANPLSISFENSSTLDFLIFSFKNALDAVPDSFYYISIHQPSFVISTSSSGTVIPTTTPIPEPTSLALLSGALGLFMLTRRLSRRGRHA